MLELLLQLGSSLLEGGAIALAKEQGKLNKDLFLLGGTFAITLCMMYSNVRAAAVASVRPAQLRREGEGRSLSHRNTTVRNESPLL